MEALYRRASGAKKRPNQEPVTRDAYGFVVRPFEAAAARPFSPHRACGPAGDIRGNLHWAPRPRLPSPSPPHPHAAPASVRAG